MSAAGFVDILRRFLAKPGGLVPMTAPPHPIANGASATPYLDHLRSERAPTGPPAAPIIPPGPGPSAALSGMGSGYSIGPQGQRVDYAPMGFVQTGAPTQPSQYAPTSPPGNLTQYGGTGQARLGAMQPQQFTDRTGLSPLNVHLSNLAMLSRMVQDQREAAGLAAFEKKTDIETKGAIAKEKGIRELPLSEEDKLKKALAETKEENLRIYREGVLANQRIRAEAAATRDAATAESQRVANAIATSRVDLENRGLISKEAAAEMDVYQNLYNQTNESLRAASANLAKAHIERTQIELDAEKNYDVISEQAKASFNKIEKMYGDEIAKLIKDRDKYLAELTKRMKVDKTAQKTGPETEYEARLAFHGADEAGTEVPPDPAQRKVGYVYTLPKGRFRWTKEGWVPAE